MTIRRRHAPLAVLVAVCAAAIAGVITAEATSKHSRRCGPRIFAIKGPPKVTPPFSGSATPLGPSVLSQFEVLRRPAGPQDALPTGQPLGEPLALGLRDYFPSYVRELATRPHGRRFYLIPGFAWADHLPLGCKSEQVRRRVIALEHRREHELRYCIVEVEPGSPPSGEASCEPFSAITTTRIFEWTSGATSELVELAPDGVATVRITYRNGTVINAPVSDNTFAFTPPQGPVKEVHQEVCRAGRAHRGRLPRAVLETVARLAPTSVQWLNPDGQVIRTLSPYGFFSRTIKANVDLGVSC